MTANVATEQQMRPEASNTDGEHSIPDDGMASRVLRKIDRNLIPVLFVTYMFNFMDKVLIPPAAPCAASHSSD